MEKPPLGTLEPVDLRTYWEKEHTEFTPWLVQDDNIRLLGEALGLNLRVVESEAGVGPFRADILAEEVGRDVRVLIENQLEQTDHPHLGAILTYAAGLEPGHVVWIAKRFVEEHRAALDWLNRMTGDEINFFGVELELWRIGDSAVAPRFNVVAKPNEWSKGVSRAASGGPRAATHEEYLEFWEGFKTYLEKSEIPLEAPRPAARNWVEIPGGPLGVRVTVSYAPATRRSNLYILVRNENDPERYSYLEEHVEEIAERTGQEFEWTPQPDRSGGWFGWSGPSDEEIIGNPLVHYEWLARRLAPVMEVLRELMVRFEARRKERETQD